DVILARDQSRLTRNGDLALHQIRRFLRMGVKLAFYATSEVLDAATFSGLSVGVQGFVDSQHREKAKRDVREGLAAYAKRGYCRDSTYGYTTRRVMGKKLYTDLAPDPEQARVVVGIFRLFADGYSPRVIVRTANGDPDYADLRRMYF